MLRKEEDRALNVTSAFSPRLARQPFSRLFFSRVYFKSNHINLHELLTSTVATRLKDFDT